jgi:hypothetical protein
MITIMMIRRCKNAQQNARHVKKATNCTADVQKLSKFWNKLVRVTSSTHTLKLPSINTNVMLL